MISRRLLALASLPARGFLPCTPAAAPWGARCKSGPAGHAAGAPPPPPPLPLSGAETSPVHLMLQQFFEESKRREAAAREERLAEAHAAREERLAEARAAREASEAREERAAERAAAERAAREERAAAEIAAREERAAAEIAAREERAAAERAAERADSLLREEAIRRDVQLSADARLADLQHELDVARGRVRARSLYEACLQTLTDSVLKTDPQVAALPPKGKAGTDLSTASGKQAMLLTSSACRALPAYLVSMGAAYGVDGQVVLKQSRTMYSTLSRPLHSTQDMERPLPEALFYGEHGKERLLAYVSVLLLAGRSPSLYAKGGQPFPFAYRRPPRSLAASEAEVLAQPLLQSHVAADIMEELAPYAPS
jgi:hypothetical protein